MSDPIRMMFLGFRYKKAGSVGDATGTLVGRGETAAISSLHFNHLSFDRENLELGIFGNEIRTTHLLARLIGSNKVIR